MDRLAREAAPGVLYDVRGEAFARLGVEGTAQYLVRPDSHIGYRSGATDLRGPERYLARWLAGVGAERPRAAKRRRARGEGAMAVQFVHAHLSRTPAVEGAT